MGGNPPVGVLALQGDFDAHIQALQRFGFGAVPVRRKSELDRVDRLIIPGGESTTVSKLLAFEGLDKAIRDRAAAGMPIWGTCMGLIVIAKNVTNRLVPTLDLLDATVDRNAYGSQLDSFEAELNFLPSASKIHGIFIRAPKILAMGADVEVVVTHGKSPVGVRQGSFLGTTFHPELTDDPTVHSYFVSL